MSGLAVTEEGSVGIATDSPHASAALDIQATDGGLLIPRMTTMQRTAIASPAKGLLAYDTDTGSFWYFENGSWNELPITIPPSESGVNSAGLALPPNQPAGVTSIITLSNPDTVAADMQFRVCIDISHIFATNLDISLASPDGTSIDLSSDNGGGSNYSGSCFTTEAANPITEGSGPFTGNWQPEGSFSSFIGKAMAGDWKLKIVVDSSNIAGQLNHWSLKISQPSSATTLLADADEDTRVSVENLPDEDVIHLEAGGNLLLRITPDSSIANELLRVHGRFVSGSNSNAVLGIYSFVGGGRFNTASGNRSFVGGGIANDATSGYSFVGGGSSNTASGDYSFIGGGGSNIASGNNSFVGGGVELLAKSYSEAVFGTYNTDYTPNSTFNINADDRLFVIGNGTSTGNRSNAVTVLKNGNVGIGTETPEKNLDLVGELIVRETNGIATFESSGFNSFINLTNNSGTGNTSVGYFDNSTDKYFFVDTPDGGFGELIIRSDGKTGIGTLDPEFLLHVDGSAGKPGGGSWSTPSDRRLKQDIAPYLDGLEKILRINPVKFRYNEKSGMSTEEEYVGIIAQEMQSIAPYTVSKTWKGAAAKEEFLVFDPNALTYMLINAVQEQQTEIEELKSQLSEMDELKQRMARLEAQFTQPAEAMAGEE